MSQTGSITRIDIIGVETAMNRLRDIAGEFGEALSMLKRTAADLEGCWGNDDAGNQFAAFYLPNAANVLNNADLMLTGLHGTEKNTRDVAERFQQDDADRGRVHRSSVPG